MCDNFQLTDETEFTGYKVVFKKGDDYYSVFSGNKYPKDAQMPIWTSQNSPVAGDDFHFRGNVLEDRDCGAWRKELQGRTAAFVSLDVVTDLYKDVQQCINKYKIKTDFVPMVVEVKLTEDLLTANYLCYAVFLGRRMKILKEVEV